MAKIPTKTLIAMAGAAAMKVRDYARENPDKVGQALDRVESTVSTRTHGKYDAKVGKGSSRAAPVARTHVHRHDAPGRGHDPAAAPGRRPAARPRRPRPRPAAERAVAIHFRRDAAG